VLWSILTIVETYKGYIWAAIAIMCHVFNLVRPRKD